MKYLILLLLSFNAFASDAGLTWFAPVEREDNTAFAETEIMEFRVYYGTKPGVYTHTAFVRRVDVGATPLSLTLALPTGFTYYFAITTVDLQERESGKSKEVSLLLDHENPKAPTGVIVLKIETTVTISPAN